jgi:hypothetical protein
MDTIIEANYVILTREQFANDYPDNDFSGEYDRVLVIHNDDAVLVAALWGSGNDFATFTADLAKYAASQADPGTVEPKVGRNVTELASARGAHGQI